MPSPPGPGMLSRSLSRVRGGETLINTPQIAQEPIVDEEENQENTGVFAMSRVTPDGIFSHRGSMRIPTVAPIASFPIVGSMPFGSLPIASSMGMSPEVRRSEHTWYLINQVLREVNTSTLPCSLLLSRDRRLDQWAQHSSLGQVLLQWRMGEAMR